MNIADALAVLGLVGLLAGAAAVALKFLQMQLEYREHYGLGSFDESTAADGGVNCPECGARNAADRDRCRHCDGSLPGADAR